MQETHKKNGTTRILLHSPDITLKGKNQDDFRKALVRNIQQRLRAAGIPWQVGSARGRAYVNAAGQAPEMVDKALALLRTTAGVSSLAATTWIRPDEIGDTERDFNWSLLEQAIVAIAGRHYVPDSTFAVRINRVDKGLPYSSKQIEIRLGDVIRAATSWDKVKLKNPDCTFYIDAYPDGLYLYADKIPGVGGLPVGTGGRVLGLLSGGIDSPVAAFTLAKRGCNVDFFHMSASHIRPDDFGQSVVARLARQLSCYTLSSRLFVMPYTYFDLALQEGKRTGYELVLFRRFMLRCAEHLANNIRAGALVAGDSLGQVASQTLENLVCASAPIHMPIFRPLIGSNKQEIIEVAERINTYGISIEPYKDCCALIAQSPKTRSFDDDMSRLEQERLPDYDNIMAKTFEDMVRFDFDCGELVTSQDK